MASNKSDELGDLANMDACFSLKKSTKRINNKESETKKPMSAFQTFLNTVSSRIPFFRSSKKKKISSSSFFLENMEKIIYTMFCVCF